MEATVTPLGEDHRQILPIVQLYENSVMGVTSENLASTGTWAIPGLGPR